MKSIGVVLVSFSLAACIAAPQTEFMGSNGKMIYPLTCQTLDGCEGEARKVCPGGYDTVPVASGAENTSTMGGISPTPVQRLSVTCK